MHDQQMIGVEQEPNGSPCLRLTGEIGPLHAADLHRVAVQLVEQRRDVLVRCDQLQSLDLTSLQILVALRDALTAQSTTLHWADLSPEVIDTITLTGLCDSLGLPCDSTTAFLATTP